MTVIKIILSCGIAAAVVGCSLMGGYQQPPDGPNVARVHKFLDKERSLFDWESYELSQVDGVDENSSSWTTETHTVRLAPGSHVLLYRVMFNIKGNGVRQAFISISLNAEVQHTYRVDGEVRDGVPYIWLAESGAVVSGPVSGAPTGVAPDPPPPVLYQGRQ